jgi:hypothetical protein
MDQGVRADPYAARDDSAGVGSLVERIADDAVVTDDDIVAEFHAAVEANPFAKKNAPLPVFFLANIHGFPQAL